MPQQLHELVVLLLKGVVFRHTEYRSLEEYLAEKYGFRRVEEKEQIVSETRQIIPANHEKIVFHEEAKSPIVLQETEEKLSTLKVYEGEYLDAKVSIYIMGDVVQREDMVTEASGEEQYPIYTSEYQLIKFVSDSGYALQQLTERLDIDLGIDVKSKEWVFHRSREG
ncbi:MAG: hypothetical protein QXK89_02815 [Candidatus Bathyarchaeia archaeon]|nr:hypothetical protein [Candidatus Bathyarchaeota archaeon]